MSKIKKISAAPSWLGLSEDRQSFIFVPERAEIVKRIFELAIGGMGSFAIANYLDERGVRPFTQSEKWDHTTIDYMLRNRATYGEYQPKSFAGGHKKGIPTGSPIADYYPAAIDRLTFETAQISRKQNLANRGRKGKDLANLFAGLGRCAYCGGAMVMHRVTNLQVLTCENDVDGNGCSRTAWTYRDFEITVLAFLAHPALPDRLEGAQREAILRLAGKIANLPTDQEKFSARVDISVALNQMITGLIVYSAGAATPRRLPSAQISKDLPGRFLEIRLWDGCLDKCVSVT